MSLLKEKAIISDYEFKSGQPLIGRVRTMWNNVAARWYVRWQFDQQIDFNLLAAQQIADQYEQLVAQDREIMALTRTVAELERQMKQLKHSAEN
ncbi:MAG: hypothetical protein ACPG8W_01385 [Candidatus Promineifilaceae bacterium]